MMAQAQPMDWSSLQCVIADARLQEGSIALRGYALGEKGETEPCCWSKPKLRRLSPAGVPIRSISIAVLAQPEGADTPEKLFAAEQTLTEQTEHAGRWHVVEAPRKMVKDGRNWGWTLWEATVPSPASAFRKWIVVAKAGQCDRHGMLEAC